MGTRNITAVFIDGEYKIAQYGQWDGYPEGQGKDALEILRSIMRTALDTDEFKRKVRACKWLENPDGKLIKDYPQCSRDHGAKILAMVNESEPGMELVNQLAFAGDSLMCEWAWVIDFDKGTFEAFKGFNKMPLDPSERFANIPKAESTSGYYPVHFVKSFQLDSLPSESEFLNAFKSEEDEE